MTDKTDKLKDLFTDITDEEELTTEQEEINRRDPDDSDEDRALPTVDKKCDKCGNDKAYYYLQQTRASDEPETRFYICKECDNKWRGYD